MEYELSYLIRMGAGKHPQCFGGFREANRDGKTTATCAWGAALEAARALGIDPGPVTCAVSVAYQHGIHIPALNDDDRLTREEIADRLDALPGGSPKVRVP